MRILTLSGIAGPLLFASVTVLCAQLRPDYSHVHAFISELGATDTPHAWLMNYAGFVPTGLFLVGFGASIKTGLRRQRAVTIGALLVVLFGAGVALSGLFSCDAGCPQEGGSTQNLVHDRLAPFTFLSGSLAAISLGLGVRKLPLLRPIWIYSIASGVAGLGLLAAVASTLETRELTGLWQRLLLAVLFSWCAVVALRLFRIDEVESPAA
ncbi:MAG: DUF998 domain-containing protein [Myxococcota bacterium]